MIRKILPFITVKYSTSAFDATEYYMNINLERALKVRNKRALL